MSISPQHIGELYRIEKDEKDDETYILGKSEDASFPSMMASDITQIVHIDGNHFYARVENANEKIVHVKGCYLDVVCDKRPKYIIMEGYHNSIHYEDENFK